MSVGAAYVCTIHEPCPILGGGLSFAFRALWDTYKGGLLEQDGYD
jgi:hypothetical protein